MWLDWAGLGSTRLDGEGGLEPGGGAALQCARFCKTLATTPSEASGPWESLGNSSTHSISRLRYGSQHGKENRTRPADVVDVLRWGVA